MAIRTRRRRSSGRYDGPQVRAVKHHWGRGYAYTFRYRGETYSGQRRRPSRTKTAAIREGQRVVRSLVEWEHASRAVTRLAATRL